MQTIEHMHRHFKSLARLYCGLLCSIYSPDMSKKEVRQYRAIEKEFRKSRRLYKIIENHLL